MSASTARATCSIKRSLANVVGVGSRAHQNPMQVESRAVSARFVYAETLSGCINGFNPIQDSRSFHDMQPKSWSSWCCAASNWRVRNLIATMSKPKRVSQSRP